MALNKRIKAPKVHQGTVGKASRFARSSTRNPTPQGITPGKTAFGILHGASKSVEALSSKTNRLFGTGSASSGQRNIARKAKRSF
jgi:hypothetical protein